MAVKRSHAGARPAKHDSIHISDHTVETSQSSVAQGNHLLWQKHHLALGTLGVLPSIMLVPYPESDPMFQGQVQPLLQLTSFDWWHGLGMRECDSDGRTRAHTFQPLTSLGVKIFQSWPKSFLVLEFLKFTLWGFHSSELGAGTNRTHLANSWFWCRGYRALEWPPFCVAAALPSSLSVFNKAS